MRIPVYSCVCGYISSCVSMCRYLHGYVQVCALFSHPHLLLDYSSTSRARACAQRLEREQRVSAVSGTVFLVVGVSVWLPFDFFCGVALQKGDAYGGRQYGLDRSLSQVWNPESKLPSPCIEHSTRNGFVRPLPESVSNGVVRL